METLDYQAMVIIYSDGYVENISITQFREHWEYLKDHMKNSKRFFSLCGDLIACGSQYPIDQRLVQNGACVLSNWNVREIVDDPLFLNHQHAHFLYFLPQTFQSLKQLSEFLKITQSISFKYVWLKVYDKQNKEKTFRSLNEAHFNHYILESKKEILAKTAITLLYPDGEMEELFLENDEYHMEYLKKHFKNSKRFSEIMGNKMLTFYNHEHYKVQEILVANGIIELANVAGSLKQESLKNVDVNTLDFDISLPNIFGSLKQIEALEMILSGINLINFNFGQFISNQLTDISYEDVVQFLEKSQFLFTNDNLKNQAIVLIYPDGEVERLLINTCTEHTLYLKKHLKSSKRFNALCKELNFDVGIHMHIDRLLLLNGVIVLYNFNIKDIVNDSSYIYNYPVGFDCYRPNAFFSEKQEREFNSIYKEYREFMLLHIYDLEKKGFIEDEGFKL